MAIFFFPTTVGADAEAENKTPLILEIKKLVKNQFSEIPSPQKTEPVETEDSGLAMVPTPLPVPPPVFTRLQSQITLTTPTTPHQIPPKAVGAARVYMHEPEIRAYICPMLGDKCNIFIAILKAENGSHECTRDNRGLNRNGSIDIGLTQINWTPMSPYSFEQLQNCKFNLDIAMMKYQARGFQPWAAYNSGRYLQHMPAVLASAAAIEAAAIKPEETMVLTN
jgi:hypothetical protein